MHQPGTVNRREFLLLRTGTEHGAIALSCERLLMKYLDAQLHATTTELFARLDNELRDVQELRLVDPEWLTRQDLAAEVDRVLKTFRARGGRVVAEAT